MDIEGIRAICKKLPDVTEDVKWALTFVSWSPKKCSVLPASKDRSESHWEFFIKQSYELVKSKLPKKKKK